jgi:NAD+ synthetase
MKIACAQINPVIADVIGNSAKIISQIEKAKKAGAEMVVFPEMATLGYPPMDLLENEKLVSENIAALDAIAVHAEDIMVICGYVDRDPSRSPSLLNAAAFMNEGRVLSRHFKSLLPTYDVFDEQRYFSPAKKIEPVCCGGVRIGITICEDIWNDKEAGLTEGFVEGRNYEMDPVSVLAQTGIDLLINISASPFVRQKNEVKHARISALSEKWNFPIIYVNQVGGNDSLIFDGGSFAAKNGRIISRAASFTEDLHVVDTELEGSVSLEEDEMDAIEKALVLGIRDYCRKCGFSKAVLGLSGGIDSAVTAALAVKALGSDNVLGVTMPSKYSSNGSVDDSAGLAKNLGIRMETIPIQGLMDQFGKDLSSVFEGRKPDVTEENLQARIRGNLLMAMSNKFGHILLTTGNKSELAMGYCTLYGDMSGGLAVISDLPKIMVYALARHLNRDSIIIPEDTITKPPSAELRENQKDQDSLPPYDILDGILESYIEKKMSRNEIIAEGYEPPVVDFVLKNVDRNEYKRRQAAPGLKVTTKAFGLGRRIPMAMKLTH